MWRCPKCSADFYAPSVCNCGYDGRKERDVVVVPGKASVIARWLFWSILIAAALGVVYVIIGLIQYIHGPHFKF